jgi:hypothetical protein
MIKTVNVSITSPTAGQRHLQPAATVIAIDVSRSILPVDSLNLVHNTYHSRCIPKGEALRYSSETPTFYWNDLALRIVQTSQIT